ncbi:hypothetical protein D9619_013737 [Psilocybe cf. subviscida]|uniref:Uncharacterized protein n=1 Tax=Psilocybe cf. subviscida TaxID=2480587 RepID=A0A8H5F4A6_9AGAR|nr:hypothetical protein D9619_013737 [Psilocybe cf. subviscida]
MAKHGAASARVFHLAHTGGTDPNERNHLTVGYFKPPVGGKPGEQIKSPWAQKYEHDNPGKTTKAWSHATAASDARKHAEAAAAAAHAEAEHKAKQERVSQEKRLVSLCLKQINRSAPGGKGSEGSEENGSIWLNRVFSNKLPNKFRWRDFKYDPSQYRDNTEQRVFEDLKPIVDDQ